MAVNWLGLLFIGVFYMMVLATGLWAARKSRRMERDCTGNRSEVAMVGRRDLTVFVSVFTTTATWVGGGYLLGNAEVVYDPDRGLVWNMLPIGFSLSLVLGGLFFIKPVHGKNYVTIMDPFQEKYGNTITSILFIPSLLADILWIACVLYTLGGTVSVMMNIPSNLAVTLSAVVAVLYTLLGGLYSVAYTDVIQLTFMLLGLWLCLPFTLSSPASADITVTAMTKLYQAPWIGGMALEDAGRWIDDLMLLTLGSVCYQAFYQRIFSIATEAQAKITCYISAVFCLILSVPPILLGAVAASTDWNQTTYGLPSPLERGEAGMILPIVLQHLCPALVSLAGTGAIAAAVMSSIDSALLSSSSLFARNIFKNIISKRASDKTILLVVKASILVFGATGAGLAMTTSSVFVFFTLSADMMYSMVFPQLLCIFFLPQEVNQHGAVTGLAVALLLRALLGEPALGVPSLVPLPGDRLREDGHLVRLFPFRTSIMLFSLATILLGSRLAVYLSGRGLLPRKWDVHRPDQHNVMYLGPVPAKELDEKDSMNTEKTLSSSLGSKDEGERKYIYPVVNRQ